MKNIFRRIVLAALYVSAFSLMSCSSLSPNAPYTNFENDMRLLIGRDVKSAYGFDHNPTIIQLPNGSLLYKFLYTNFGECTIFAWVNPETHKILSITHSGSGCANPP